MAFLNKFRIIFFAFWIVLCNYYYYSLVLFTYEVCYWLRKYIGLINCDYYTFNLPGVYYCRLKDIKNCCRWNWYFVAWKRLDRFFFFLQTITHVYKSLIFNLGKINVVEEDKSISLLSGIWMCFWINRGFFLLNYLKTFPKFNQKIIL